MRSEKTVLSLILVAHSLAGAFIISFVGRIGRIPTRLNHRLHFTLATEEFMNSSSPQDIRYPVEMTEEEKYLFDLNGFIVVRGVLNEEEVESANKAIDNHASEMVERSDPALRNTVKGTKFYGHGPGRMDLGRVFEWGEESKV